MLALKEKNVLIKLVDERSANAVKLAGRLITCNNNINCFTKLTYCGGQPAPR